MGSDLDVSGSGAAVVIIGLSRLLWSVFSRNDDLVV
jgi:hypothetical protein